jgi:hypothetical protein
MNSKINKRMKRKNNILIQIMMINNSLTKIYLIQNLCMNNINNQMANILINGKCNISKWLRNHLIYKKLTLV